MPKMLRESSDLVARHALSGLSPTNAVDVRLATRQHLDRLADIANREIPGVNVTAHGLARFLHNDPETIFVFQRQGRVLGGAAFLYLNERGHDALILDDIDLTDPAMEFLAQAGAPVSAIYTWALAGHGRAVIGLGNVAAHHRRARFAGADYFAAPATPAGRDLLKALSFQRTPSFQPELWTYPRMPAAPGGVVSEPPAPGVSHHVHA